MQPEAPRALNVALLFPKYAHAGELPTMLETMPTITRFPSGLGANSSKL